jgi:hypothetical protein
VRKLVQQADILENISGASEYLQRFQRSNLIAFSVHPWLWIESVVSCEIEARLSEMEPAGERDWLDELVETIRTALVTSASEMVFNPLTQPLLQSLSQDRHVCANQHIGPNATRITRDDPNLPLIVVRYAQKILPDWLGIGSGKEGRNKRIRAWFVDAAVRILGPEILTTDIMWRAFTQFKARPYTGNNDIIYREDRHFTSTLIKPFEVALKEHPICAEGSEEKKVYDAYKALVS